MFRQESLNCSACPCVCTAALVTVLRRAWSYETEIEPPRHKDTNHLTIFVSLVPLWLRLQMPDKYRERVYAIVRRIPSGRVMTYGQIAELLGEGYTPRTV